jgi:serine/threonine protein kinase
LALTEGLHSRFFRVFVQRGRAMELKTVGDYDVGEPLGEGTVGTVYRARHRQTREEVALKVLIPAAARNEAIQKRFAREIEVVQKLDHPNIIQHSFNGMHEGMLYYTMELARFGSLEDVLRKRGTLPWREAAQCGMQIAAALHVLHASGIIHRDLKPANIYLSHDGQLKIGDFGLARDAVSSKLTLEGQTVGTIRYMAPEQIRGRPDIDGRLDLYALGCVLFRCVAGRPPIEGVNALDTFEKHLRQVPPRLDTVIADCPASFAAVVAKLLEKDPSRRPPNGNAVSRTLARVLENPSRAIGDEDFDTDDANSAPGAHGETNLAERLKTGEAASGPGISWKKLAIVFAVVAVGVLVLLFVRRG